MTQAVAQVRTRDFSLAGLEDILLGAREHGFQVMPFRDLPRAAAGAPTLLLRHDVDHSLELALALGRQEAAMGISATYFVLTGTAAYNVLAPESKGSIRELADLGHEIGLHYDASTYEGRSSEQKANIRLHLAVLESLSGQPVVSASAHNPVNAGVLPVDSMVTYHTYSARFMREMPYVSDSNQAWRQWHPLDLVERRQTFHLLLHPLWWVLPGHDWEMKLREVERRANERYSAFMASEIERQRVSLRDRAELDGQFRGQYARSP